MLEPYILPDYSDLIVTPLWPHFDLTGIMLRIRGIIPKWPYFSLKSWGKCELYWTYQCYIELGHTNHCNPHSIHIQTYIMRVKQQKQPFGNGLYYPIYKNGDFPGGWCKWNCFTHMNPWPPGQLTIRPIGRGLELFRALQGNSTTMCLGELPVFGEHPEAEIAAEWWWHYVTLNESSIFMVIIKAS